MCTRRSLRVIPVLFSSSHSFFPFLYLSFSSTRFFSSSVLPVLLTPLVYFTLFSQPPIYRQYISPFVSHFSHLCDFYYFDLSSLCTPCPEFHMQFNLTVIKSFRVWLHSFFSNQIQCGCYHEVFIVRKILRDCCQSWLIINSRYLFAKWHCFFTRVGKLRVMAPMELVKAQRSVRQI